MTRFAMWGSVVTILGALTFASVRPSLAGDACARKEFKTKLVKDACQKGGQPAAKDAMKAFMKQAKLKNCNVCHSKLGPGYELKPTGLNEFTKLGGR